MAPRLLLYFASGSRALYRWRRRALHLEKRFAPTNDGLEELRQSLGRYPRALLDLVVDLAGEDFHEDRIPLLRGSERRIVIERRLAQRYREARLTCAASLGIAPDERRSERLLLASLPQSDALEEWLDACLQAPVTLRSVVSPALLAPALSSALKLHRGGFLLVTANTSGLRQSFIDGRRLRFSRLEHAFADAISPAFVRRELERTLQFLENSRAIPAERPPFPIVLVIPDEHRATFEAELPGDDLLAFRVLGVAEAAKLLKLREFPRDDAANPLYLHAAALGAPKEQFLNRADRRPFIQLRIRRTIVGIGASTVAACLAYAGLLWLESRNVRVEIASVRAQVAALQAQERQHRSQFAATSVAPDLVKAAATEFRRIIGRTAKLEPALAHLSSALDQAPEIELEALAWQSTDPSAQALEVSARVHTAAASDYRDIGRHIERFSKLLASPEWQVAGTRMPFDAAPQNPLAGDFGTREASERTRFAITLVGAPR